MRDLSRWSTRKVIVACVLWLIGAPVAAALGLVLAGLVLAGLSGKTQIALRASITNLALGWLFLPPVLLVSAWVWSKGRRLRPLSDEADADQTTG